MFLLGLCCGLKAPSSRCPTFLPQHAGHERNHFRDHSICFVMNAFQDTFCRSVELGMVSELRKTPACLKVLPKCLSLDPTDRQCCKKVLSDHAECVRAGPPFAAKGKVAKSHAFNQCDQTAGNACKSSKPLQLNQAPAYHHMSPYLRQARGCTWVAHLRRNAHGPMGAARSLVLTWSPAF